jgi:hypothetical protein
LFCHWNGKCWYILWPFGIFYYHLVYYVVIWYVFTVLVYFYGFGTLYQEKFGNPAHVFRQSTQVQFFRVAVSDRAGSGLKISGSGWDWVGLGLGWGFTFWIGLFAGLGAYLVKLGSGSGF